VATVRLGNARAVAVQGDQQRIPLGEQVTTASIPDSYTLDEKVRTISHADGLWAVHSDAPGPSWVESDDVDLLGALSQHYGCPIGRPVTEEGESDEG
jgi:hypothetical protein